MPKIKPFGLELAIEKVKNHAFEKYQDWSNQRKAHCKVCGGGIPKGEGIQYYYWQGEEKQR